MSITRRQIVLSMPAAAASTMVAGCGGGGSSPSPSAASAEQANGRATAQAISTGSTSGALSISAYAVGSFPSSNTPLQPTDQLIQACLNGKTLHANLCHTTSQGQIRSVSLKLRNTVDWALNTEYSFNAAKGTLEGTVSHFNAPTASDFATTRRIYTVRNGTVKATRTSDSTVRLVFSPSAVEEVVATATIGTSPNAAAPGDAVGIRNSTALAQRNVTVNLTREDEGSA